MEDGKMVMPYDDDLKIDYAGFRDFVNNKYNGDSAKMSIEEKKQFILKT